eukprot:500407-Prorocentrum_minimum.AAC.1
MYLGDGRIGPSTDQPIPRGALFRISDRRILDRLPERAATRRRRALRFRRFRRFRVAQKADDSCVSYRESNKQGELSERDFGCERTYAHPVLGLDDELVVVVEQVHEELVLGHHLFHARLRPRQQLIRLQLLLRQRHLRERE